ncbi:hypothetical protein GALL_417170 [mine drainage metagenome]|uniref:Uncharacterized protein n=1 Tax=mine drainage metagenome TaxID=410659 RepID=A0A1J5PYN7_9ZZZZ
MLAAPAAPRQRVLDAVVQQHAVGQPGQRVVIRQLLRARLGLALLGDVGQRRDIVGQLAVARLHRRNRQALGEQRAVLAAAAQLALPIAVARHRVAHRGVERRVVPPRLQQRRRVADDFVRRVAGDAAERLVDALDARLCVGDDDAVLSLERDRRDAQILVVAHAVGDVLDRAAQPPRTPIGAELDAPQSVHPALPTVAATHDAVLAVEGAAPREHLVREIARHRVAVGRVDQLRPAVDRAFISRIDAEQPVEHRRALPASAVDVEHVAADAGDFLRFAQRLERVGQLLLVALALGDVAGNAEHAVDAAVVAVQRALGHQVSDVAVGGRQAFGRAQHAVALHHRAVVGGDLRGLLGGEDRAVVGADDVRRAAPGHARDFAVDEGVATVAVLRENRVGRIVEQLGDQPPLARVVVRNRLGGAHRALDLAHQPARQREQQRRGEHDEQQALDRADPAQLSRIPEQPRGPGVGEHDPQAGDDDVGRGQLRRVVQTTPTPSRRPRGPGAARRRAILGCLS